MNGREGNEIKLFVVSALLSAFAFNLFLMTDISYELNDIMSKICCLKSGITNRDIIPYVLFKRLKQIFVIYIMLRAFKAETVIDVLIIGFGVFLGMSITAQTYLNGFWGLVVLIVSFVPHYPIYFYLIKNLYNLNRCVIKDKAFWGYFFMSISILGIGIVCECFFSTFFLKQIYQYMVMNFT